MRFWLFDRRCDLARWLGRLADAVVNTSKCAVVCVRVDETIDGATVEQLLITCLRRAKHGASQTIISARAERTLAAVVRVVDDESFDTLLTTLKSEMAPPRVVWTR